MNKRSKCQHRWVVFKSIQPLLKTVWNVRKILWNSLSHSFDIKLIFPKETTYLRVPLYSLPNYRVLAFHFTVTRAWEISTLKAQFNVLFSGHVNAEQEEQERQKAKDASVNDRLMYMFQLQNLASHKAGVTPANGEIGGQPISVVNPHQVSLMQMDLPDKNPDIPLLASSHTKPSITRTKTRKRVFPVRKPVFAVKGVFPFGKRVLPFRTQSIRPRLAGTFRIKTPWRPTPRRFWKRSYGSHGKGTVDNIKYLRRMARKRSKRKSVQNNRLVWWLWTADSCVRHQLGAHGYLGSFRLKTKTASVVCWNILPNEIYEAT